MRPQIIIRQILAHILQGMGFLVPDKMVLEAPKEKKFGDLAINVALLLAKEAGKNPRELAEAIATELRTSSEHIAKVEVAGPGFLNVTFTPEFWHETISLVEQQGATFGSSTKGSGRKIQVEYVSSNPTGPLHIGHGRGAALGDSLLRILTFVGFEAFGEYYINDAGNQMRTLGLSIWLRLLAKANLPAPSFPADCYQGDYIEDIAKNLWDLDPEVINLPEDEGIEQCYRYGLEVILCSIKEDLHCFRVHHDVWFSELSLVQDGKVKTTLDTLQKKGHVYEKDGALWFASEQFGDDKDRVLRKSDGSLTYFASDMAYHANKFERGFDVLIDIWGADHHGYIPRMRAAIQAFNEPAESFDVVLVQLVNLLRDGVQIAMSTRAGEFVTLAEVIAEVGIDAARFIFLSRKSDSALDFDLDLVKQRTMENPVYYVQYAHARVKAVLRRAVEQDIHIDMKSSLALLTDQESLDLMRCIDRFSQVVDDAARTFSPHFVSYYLMDLAGALHKFYATHHVLQAENKVLINARLRLLQATAQVVKNGLALLGVSAPDKM